MLKKYRQGLLKMQLFLLGLLLAWVLGACTAQVSSRGSASTQEDFPPTNPSPIQPNPSATLEPTNTPSSVPSFTPTLTTTLTPSPTPLTCWKEDGRVESRQLQTELLRLPLDFRVYLPPCYQQREEHRFPVLYLIHGQSFTDDQWDRLGADETADRLIAAGDAPPFIIVMPRDRVWSQPTDNLFGQAVINVLIPWIDENYRTLPAPKQRAVGGLSRGAGWALHLGFSRWDMFGSIGMHSLPVFWTDLPDIKPWLDEIPPGQLPRIYMDIGENDRPQIMKSTLWFENLLTKKGIPHEWHLYPGYHEEAYWQSHMEEYLKWYTEEW